MDFEGKISENVKYSDFIEKMHNEDLERLEFSKKISSDLSIIKKSIYTTMKWPVKLVQPMFDARAAYAVPNNYFQNLFLNEERLGNSFAHGAMRSVFFIKDKLILFSKTVNFRDGQEFFTSFILAHFEKGEYTVKYGRDNFQITVNCEKSMKNLIDEKVEKKKIVFSFSHESVLGRMVSREQVINSSRFKNVYERFGGANIKAASIDLEGYAITVPHFAPHPYMLLISSELGFLDKKDMQLEVKDYFQNR